jgi:flagellin
VINVGLKDFSYNLGVPAVASESKFTLSSIDADNDNFADSADLNLTGKQFFDITIGGTAISFSLTRAIGGTVMTENELVDFETNMTKAVTDTAGFSNVSVTRVGNEIYVRDAEGRAMTAASALRWGTSISSGVLQSATGTPLAGASISTGAVAVSGIEPAATAVFSGSARLNDTQIKTQAGSNLAISRLDNAMANVDQERAVYGSIMNRLTYAGDNLTNVSQNTSFSRSRILDTDYASATTELARTQIIQQAGMAMLAQANQQPQTVLSLLQ